MKKIIFLFTCLLNSFTFYAQHTLLGRVTTAEGDPLAFVNMIVNSDQRSGTMTDIDGKFELSNVQVSDTVILTYVGYERQEWIVDKSNLEAPLQLQMTAVAVGLEAVTVFAGENPAHRIIQKVVENRDRNDPEKYEQYTCRTYNKMRFGVMPRPSMEEEQRTAKAKISKKEEQLQQWKAFSDDFYISVMETVTKKQFRAPNHYRETILHNRVAGLKEPEFVSLAKDAQPFSFYSPNLIILGETYLNPISRGSTKLYFFDWTETIVAGQDTTFIITFRPKKGKTFEGLKGVLYIHSNGYAIQNVIASPADVVKTALTIEQKYSYHLEAQKWFPEQLNMEWLMSEYPSNELGTKIEGKSYITAVDFNTNLSKRDFTRDKYQMAAGVFDLDDTGWEAVRVDSLTQKEQATYVHVDSLAAEKNVEAKLKAMQSILSGRFPIGKVDINTERLVAFNVYENIRTGIGVRTNEKWSRKWSIGGYAGYGWRDKTWKYGGDVQLQLSDKYRAKLTMGYLNDLLPIGQMELPRWQAPFAGNAQNLYQPILDQNELLYTRLTHRFLKNIDVEWQLSNQVVTPNNGYTFLHNDRMENRFRFNEMSLQLRYAYGEQTVTFMGMESPIPSYFPIVHLNLTHGLWLLDEGNIPYQRYLLGIEQQIPLHRFGSIEYSLEAAWQSGDVPLTKLFLSNGLGSGIRLNFMRHTFQTMQPNEFVSNQLAHLFLRWNIGTLTKKFVHFQPEISLVHQVAIGQMTTPLEQHLNVPLKTLENGFFESGLEVGNLLRFPYANMAYLGLGGGVYYRHGANQLPTTHENLGYRVLLTVSF